MFDLMHNLVPKRKVIEVGAKLHSDDIPNLRGELEISIYEDDGYEFEFELCHYGTVFNSELEILVNRESVGFAPPQHNITDFIRCDVDGDLGFTPMIGQVIEVAHAGQIICKGVLTA